MVYKEYSPRMCTSTSDVLTKKSGPALRETVWKLLESVYVARGLSLSSVRIISCTSTCGHMPMVKLVCQYDPRRRETAVS